MTIFFLIRYTSLSSYKIILGTNNNDIMVENGGIRRTISKIIKHENYDLNDYYNDIALIKLSVI
jgi:hypothetical protein